jgi:hypothetical protein
MFSSKDTAFGLLAIPFGIMAIAGIVAALFLFVLPAT